MEKSKKQLIIMNILFRFKLKEAIKLLLNNIHYVLIIIYPFLFYHFIGKSSKYSNLNIVIDEYFLLIKSYFIFFTTSIYFLKNIKKYKNTKYINKYYILLSLYFILFLISSIFSKYNDITIIGGFSDYEGLMAIFSYIMLFILSYQLLDKKIIKCLSILTVIIFNLSLFEYFFGNPVQHILNLFFDKNINILNHLKITLTFFNSAYLGSFCILIMPIFIYRSRNKIDLILYNLLFVVIILTKSTASLIIAITQIILINIKNKKYLSSFISLIIFILFIPININTLKNNEVGNINNTISKLELSNNKFNINSNQFDLSINLDKPYSHYEKINNIVNLEYFNNQIKIDLGYKMPFSFYKIDDKWYFLKDNMYKSKFKYEYNSKLDKYYKLFTGRGYTWINSIDLLRKCLIIGKGPSTLIYYFNQDDMLGVLNVHGTYKILVDRMNNWYLKIFYSSGFISLILIIIIFGLFIKESFEVKNKLSNEVKGIIIGCLSFMIISCIDDSSVAVTPYFWLLLGIGLKYVHCMSHCY